MARSLRLSDECYLMHVDINEQTIQKVIEFTAYGVSSVVTFFWTLNRIFQKKIFNSTAGDVVQKSATATEQQVEVTQKLSESISILRDMVDEIRDNSKYEREVWNRLLESQIEIGKSNASIVQLLQALINRRR